MTGLAERIMRAAHGDPCTEAAAHIATQALSGRMLQVLAPWIDDDPTAGMAWIDWRATVTESVGLSSGERHLIGLAASLATWGHRGVEINLADALTGLDEHNAHIVATAVAHALNQPEPRR